MRVTEEQARKMWCPFVRIEGSNRLMNTMTDGFDAEHRYQHCIGGECMAWRSFHFTYTRADSAPAPHGYCGLAGKPDAGD
jgi:hypothetical protein